MLALYNCSNIVCMQKFVYICVIICTLACEGVEKYSEIPEIELEKFTTETGYDALSNKVLKNTISFWFRDGNADIYAVSWDDSSGIFYQVFDVAHGNNELLKTTRTELIPTMVIDSIDKSVVPPDTFFTQVDIPIDIVDTVQHVKIPHGGNSDVFNKQGIDKSITGTIDFSIEHNINFVNTYDTVKYRVYLVDRENHKSNTIEVDKVLIEFSE